MKREIRHVAARANSGLGNLFYRAVSVVPAALLIVVVNSLIGSIRAAEYLTALILLIPTILLGLLIRFLWSRKRTLGDVIDANS